MITGNSWLNPKLEVRTSELHGKGVFASENIRRGERLAIFGGSIMPIDEIKNLPESIRDYTMQIEERFVLGHKTLVLENTDYFNHSCNPNSGFHGQLFLVAVRDIKKGEEITFDYAMVLSKSVESDIVFEMNCNCGTPNCRKKITEDDWKRPELQIRYKGYFSEYLKQMILSEKNK